MEFGGLYTIIGGWREEEKAGKFLKFDILVLWPRNYRVFPSFDSSLTFSVLKYLGKIKF